MEQDMALPTGVHKRGAVFHIQIKVPSDLRACWPTPFYVRKSLGTEDRAQATAAAHRLWAEATEAFALARLKLRPPEFSALTPALTAYIVTEASRVPLGVDDAIRFTPDALLWQLRAVEQRPVQFLTAPEGEPTRPAKLPDYLTPSEDGSITSAQLARLKQLQSLMVGDLAASVSMGRLGEAKTFAEATCASLGIRVDWDTPAHRMALVAVLRALLGAWIGAAEKSEGKLVHTPPVPEAPPSSSGSVQTTPVIAKTTETQNPAALKLRDVVQDWKAAKKPSEDSTARTERALKHLEASGQNVPVAEMKRSHGAALRAYLLHDDREFNGKTGLNYWQALMALLNIAHDVGHIDSNPWHKMTFEVTGSETRKPYSDEELQQLFHTPLFQSGQSERIQKVASSDAYWCMLLGLWSGARVGELAQLELADVKAHNGLTVLSIHGKAGTLKTEQSERLIPVAPELIRLGFVGWAKAQREAGAVKLFPSFHREGAVTPGEIMSEWNREYRRIVGAAAGPLNGFHRFRHTIRTRLAALQIGPETADTLTGHAAQGSSGRRVYTHVDAKVVYEALARLRFPLKLPRVFTGTHDHS
jgi:integrase